MKLKEPFFPINRCNTSPFVRRPNQLVNQNLLTTPFPTSGLDNRCGYFALATSLLNLNSDKILFVLKKIKTSLKDKTCHEFNYFLSLAEKRCIEPPYEEKNIFKFQRAVGDALYDYVESTPNIRRSLQENLSGGGLSSDVRNRILALTFISADLLQAIAKHFEIEVALKRHCRILFQKSKMLLLFTVIINITLRLLILNTLFTLNFLLIY